MRFIYESDDRAMPEPGDARVLLTEQAIIAAMERFDEKVARADVLLDQDGDEGVLEALRRRGALREEWRGDV